MKLGFYMDDDTGLPALVSQAAVQGFVALRSDDVGMRGRADEDHLAYAAQRHLMLVTCNGRDFRRLHENWLADGRSHSGIMIVNQSIALGERVRVLLWLANAGSAEDFIGRVEYLRDWQ